MTMATLPTKEEAARRYYDLCDQRDAAYARAAPIEATLAEANARCEAARLEAGELAAEVEAAWGPDHLALKTEIAGLARFLGKIPPRPEK